MTKQEYRQYEAAVAEGLEGLTFVSTGLCPGCPDCASDFNLSQQDFDDQYEAGQLCEEPYFSWRPCECCHRPLGGDRYPAHGRDTNDEIVHFTVCADCMYYIAYGRLDDTTMAEIDAA